MTVLDLYRKEYLDKQFERTSLFTLIKDNYNTKKALYPGSFVHVAPSFVIPYVVYVDSDKNARKFFKNDEAVSQFIAKNKIYPEEVSFRCIHSDYFNPLDLPEKSFDLLISQWADPVSQACKKYLRPGGILLANNSHADAGIAYLDSSYALTAIVRFSNGKFSLSERDLESYFIPKRDEPITIDSLLQSGRGIAYQKTANAYIFRKIT